MRSDAGRFGGRINECDRVARIAPDLVNWNIEYRVTLRDAAVVVSAGGCFFVCEEAKIKGCDNAASAPERIDRTGRAFLVALRARDTPRLSARGRG